MYDKICMIKSVWDSDDSLPDDSLPDDSLPDDSMPSDIKQEASGNPPPLFALL